MKKGMMFSFIVLAFVALAFAAATKFTSLHVTDSLQVDGATTLNGTVTAGVLVIPLVDVTVATPTVVGQLVRTSSYVVYIGTNTTGLNGWQKVGTQS